MLLLAVVLHVYYGVVYCTWVNATVTGALMYIPPVYAMDRMHAYEPTYVHLPLPPPPMDLATAKCEIAACIAIIIALLTTYQVNHVKKP